MLDGAHTWSRPVIIKVNGAERMIEAPAEASRVLYVEWPGDRTAKHKAACEAVKAAMEGADPEVAWVAFIEACIERGLLIE
jgi:hypothetical protein